MQAFEGLAGSCVEGNENILYYVLYKNQENHVLEYKWNLICLFRKYMIWFIECDQQSCLGNEKKKKQIG